MQYVDDKIYDDDIKSSFAEIAEEWVVLRNYNAIIL